MDSITMTTEQQLPEGWKKTTLGEISIIKMGQSPSGQSYNKQNNGYQLIGGASDLGEKFPQPQKFTSDAIKLSKINDIIICIRATIGRLNLSDKVYCLGRGVAGIEVNENIETKFIWYSLMNNEAYLLKNSTGTTFQQISSPTLKKLPIIYPTSKETQQAIVNKIESLFDEIDEGIGRLKTAAQQIQQYRQSLLKNAFNGELTKEWRSKHADTLPSEHELLAQIQTTREQHHAQQLADWQTAVSQWEQNGKEGKKPSKPKAPTQAVKFEENFADLPNGWGVIRFENICDLIRNGISVKPEGESGTKIFRISAVRPFQLNLDDYRFLNTDDVGDFVLNNGDLLFTRYNGTRNFVGVCAEFKSNEIYVYPDKLIRAVVNSTEINNTFLMYGFNTGISREFIESRIRTTAGQSGISGSDIKAIPVIICSLAEQTQIVAILESKLTACNQLADELAKQLKQAELLKQAVLKAAFSGSLLDK